MAAEKRLKSELTKVKDQLTNAKAEARQRRGSSCSNGRGSSCRNGHAEDDGYPNKKIKKLEEELDQLEKSLAAKEQEETMLLKEMEVHRDSIAIVLSSEIGGLCQFHREI